MKTAIVTALVIFAGIFVLVYAINTVRLIIAKRRFDKSLKGVTEKDHGSNSDTTD